MALVSAGASVTTRAGSLVRLLAHLLFTVGLVTAVISLLVSNTATTAIMLPVGLGILANLGPVGGQRHQPLSDRVLADAHMGFVGRGGAADGVTAQPHRDRDAR